MGDYLPRLADQELAAQMRVMGAVLIEGPKACGKTSTAVQVANTTIRLDEDEAARSLVRLDPASLFNGTPPILFDEWQVEPAIWNRIRRQVDHRSKPGQFLLTGSATPRNNAHRHSGAGRISILRMRPMSLFENGSSTGSVSLAALLKGKQQTGDGTHLNYDELLRLIVIGGWPQLIGKGEEFARTWLQSYLQQIVEVDIPELGPRRNPRNLQRLLAALARGVSQGVKFSELAKDVGGAPGPVASETLTGYLGAIDRLYLSDNSLAWQPHIRSRARLRTTPVRYFVDPSLGPAALNIGTAELRADLQAACFHFEALVLRDLRIYAQGLHGVIDSWRDSNGHEVDAILTLRGGAWAAFEIKLNPAAVDEAAKSLLRFAKKIDHDQHGEALALGVITSAGYAGQRPDGVHVIPIGTLGP